MMQACGTSLAGALNLGAKIAIGQIECGIALGSDTTSDAPIVFQRRFAQRLVQASRAKGFGQKLLPSRASRRPSLRLCLPRPQSPARGSAWASIAS